MMPVTKKLNEINTLKEYCEYLRAERLASDKQEALALAMQLRLMSRRERKDADELIEDREWKKLYETVEQLKQEWNRGYNNDWITSTYAMWAIIQQLTTAMHASKPVSSLIGLLADPLSDVAANYLHQWTYMEPPEKALPRLMCHAEFTNDHKLDVSSLAKMTRSDGQPMFPKQASPDAQNVQNELQKKLENQLRLGVMAWLRDLGYKPSTTTPGVFVDKDNIQLTKSVFERLCDNKEQPSQSFQACLKREFNLDFEVIPRVTPAPRP